MKEVRKRTRKGVCREKQGNEKQGKTTQGSRKVKGRKKDADR
jgi:hypothetical protein